jgi:hypothetical protein
MADVWVKVLTPADSYALVTLDELKGLLNISLTDTSEDALLQTWIDQYSDVVATMCNRVFGYETVEETWRSEAPPFDRSRLFLTRYPVADGDITAVESPRGSVLDPVGYEVENESGKMRTDGAWTEPVTVTYSGGYHLPDEAPQALKAAVGLLIQAARLQMRMGMTSGMRQIAHRESRVTFFDPVQMLGKAGLAGPLQAATETVNALLYKYMRFYV